MKLFFTITKVPKEKAHNCVSDYDGTLVRQPEEILNFFRLLVIM